jgi:tRNA (mo5U34)-methyltransferase
MSQAGEVKMQTEDIVQRAKELAPWHFDFVLTPTVSTANLNPSSDADPDKRGVKTIDPYEMKSFFDRYYPQGLAGKDVLDVGCNAGGYCFVAGELGARSVIGFDIRAHWLKQAAFIQAVKYPHLSNVKFEKGDAKTFTEKVDIVIFKGVFYHLPDPIHVLLSLCNSARETILIDTASSDKVPEHCLTPIQESRTHVMSGVDGLAWLPGGPAALTPILRYAGFASIEVIYWHHRIMSNTTGRFRIAARR